MNFNHCHGCLCIIPQGRRWCEDCAEDARAPMMPDLAQRIAGRLIFVITVVLVVVWIWRVWT
jgi:hypothetical protein